VRRYSVNHYGPLNDRINRGLESDRVYAEWWIRSRRVERRIAGEHEPAPEGSALVEIPLNINEIKERNMEEARRWLFKVRSELNRYLSSGYIAHDVIREGDRCFYVLSKVTLNEILEK